MAMELWVLSDRQLASVAEWQRAIDAEGFPLRLSNETRIENIDGFVSAYLRDQSTGFECSHLPAAEFIREMPQIDFGREWKYVLAFRWRADFNELRAAWIAGAAYARATDGIVLDDQEAMVRNAEEACAAARREYEAPDPRPNEMPDLDIDARVDEILRQFRLGPYSEP
jgi:hypothetical protein